MCACSAAAGVDKDERAMAIERSEIERLSKDRDDERAIQERAFLNRLREKLLGHKASGGFKGIKSGTVLTEEILAEHPRGAWRHIGVQDDRDHGRDRDAEARNRHRRWTHHRALRWQGGEAAAR